MGRLIGFFAKIMSILKIFPDKIIYLNYRNKFSIHQTFRFNGAGISFSGTGKIIIEENSYIGQYSILQVDKDCNIKIGRNCKISHFVKIYTTSSYSDQDFNEKVKNYCKDVEIGDGVWIGANVFINPGVIIGENSIVGANSVVTKNVEPFSIVGGVPAKFIRYKDVDR